MGTMVSTYQKLKKFSISLSGVEPAMFLTSTVLALDIFSGSLWGILEVG